MTTSLSMKLRIPFKSIFVVLKIKNIKIEGKN